MPSSTSWQRYDEEHNVSAILTEAARACVVENPRDVTDYFARYFREVASGTSVKLLHCCPVLGSHAGPATTFTLKLSTGPDATITTADATVAASLLHSSRKRDSRKDGDKGYDAADLYGEKGSEALLARYEEVQQKVQSSLLPQLCRLGSVEPQSAWDDVLTRAWPTADPVTLSVQWALSVLAALAAAKQRRITLYQHVRTLLAAAASSGDSHGGKSAFSDNNETHNDHDSNKRAGRAGGSAVLATKSALLGEQAGGAAGQQQCYAPPRLLVPFLVNDASAAAPGTDASGQVHFAKVYVSLEPITSALNEDGEDDNDGSRGTQSNYNNTSGASSATNAVDGATLRRRVRQLHRAARLFLRANATAREGVEGCVHWSGAGSLVEVVRAVTEALEAAELRPGVDVCLGLALGANEVRVRTGNESEGALGGAAGGGSSGAAAAANSSTTVASTASSTAASKAAAAAAAAAAADPSGLYDFFHGDSAITGEQLSEYVKEQLDEIGPGVVQLLEDTHSMDDTVARQRLQLALQDVLVLSGNTALPDASPYAEQRRSDVRAGAYPATVVDLTRCATLDAAVHLLRDAADAGRSAVTAMVGPAAGDAAAAAHLVDVAVAGQAATLLTHAGVLSATTMAVATRLAAVLTELAAVQGLAPRVPFKRYNRYDFPPLPEVDVAPIRHKGDKKKKDTRKTSTKKK